MQEKAVELREMLRTLAERTVRRYASGLLSGEELVERLLGDWSGEMSGTRTWESLAFGLCSQALYEACLLPGGRLRELAFERLREYLERLLIRVGGTRWHAPAEVRDEVIQQTLVEIVQSLQRERGRPEQPAAFLAWARVILNRQLAHYWRRESDVDLLSLEAQEEPLLASLIDEHAPDPLDTLLWSELCVELRATIASLRNPRYREVLLKTYFAELEESELAVLLQASVADIYLWRCRGLQALRKQADKTVAKVAAKKKRVVA